MSDQKNAETFTLSQIVAALGGQNVGGAQPVSPSPIEPLMPAAAGFPAVSAIESAVMSALTKLAGQNGTAGPTGVATATTNIRTDAVPPPIAMSAPSTAVPLERPVSVLELSKDQVFERMRQSGAERPWAPYDPRNRSARKTIRVAWEQALATRRVRLGTGPR